MQDVSRINSSTLAMLLPLSSLGKALSFLCSLLLPFPRACRLEMSPAVQYIYWSVYLFVYLHVSSWISTILKMIIFIINRNNNI